MAADKKGEKQRKRREREDKDWLGTLRVQENIYRITRNWIPIPVHSRGRDRLPLPSLIKTNHRASAFTIRHLSIGNISTYQTPHNVYIERWIPEERRKDTEKRHCVKTSAKGS